MHVSCDHTASACMHACTYVLHAAGYQRTPHVGRSSSEVWAAAGVAAVRSSNSNSSKASEVDVGEAVVVHTLDGLVDLRNCTIVAGRSIVDGEDIAMRGVFPSMRKRPKKVSLKR